MSATMGAQEIYENFSIQAKGTEGLATAQLTAQQLAAKYQDRAVTTQQMMDTIQSGWKGTAAEAASQGLAPFVENSLTNHGQLGTGQDIVSRQIASFHTAVSEVRPVPPEPRMQDTLAGAMAGVVPQPMLTQLAQHQAIQQANVDAYSKYVSASQYNTTNLPPLSESVSTQTAAVAVAAPVARPEPAPSGGGPRAPHVPGSSGGGSESGPPHTPSSGGRGPLAPGGGTPAGPGPGGGSAPVGPGGGTTISAAPPPPVAQTPPPLTPPPSGSGAGAGPGSGQPAWPVGPGGGVLPPGDGEPSPRAGGPGGGTGTGARAGAGEALPGEGGPGTGTGVRGGVGPPGEGEPGPGGPTPGWTSSGGGAASGEDGVGGRSGAGAGSVAAEEEALAAERGMTAPEATSQAAGPMLAGRGQKGGEDAEHRRRYRVDEDGDLRFGSAEKVAPPVIGESAAARAARYETESGRHPHDR